MVLYSMYSDWVSLSENIKHDTSHKSVLSVYPSSVGRDVARTVVRSLVENSAESASEGRFSTPSDVEWVMQVICFGLGLPLSEGETLKGCVTVYLDWLSALSSQPKQEVPKEILREPNTYCQRILQHFKNLFVPKTEGTLALQASLCMKVLQGVQRISHECRKMNERTLKVLLQFLLSVSDLLLSPPFVPGGLTEQLCSFLIEVLFDVWLQACVWAFPEPPLWKTMQEMCCNWRHHPEVVALWNKSIFSITRRVLLVEYGSSFPLYPLDDKKHEIRIPTTLDNKCLVQSWFRFLHVLGNPVDLSSRRIVSNTTKFKENALVSASNHQPSLHPCLNSLPRNFYVAFKGIAVLVDTFLGIKCNTESPVMFRFISPYGAVQVASKNDDKKRVTAAVSTDQLAHIPNQMDGRPSYLFSHAMGGVAGKIMPTENSILHLLGPWLFEAALTHVNIKLTRRRLAMTRRNLLTQERTDIRQDSIEEENEEDSRDNEFEQGKAEAFGALCRIFCSQRSSKILPVYLSRFYFSLCAGLLYDKPCSGHVLSSILLNSIDLLRVNLPGVDVIIPQLIAALEIVLCQPDFNLSCNVPMVQLQRAGIHLLLSMLCLPYHFGELPVSDISCGKVDNEKEKSSSQTVTFISLKARLIKLLLRALENETDSHNTQMLLGGVMLFIQDCALVEHSKDTMPLSPNPTSLTTEFLLDEVLAEKSGDDAAEKCAGENDKIAFGQNDVENAQTAATPLVESQELGGSSSRHLFTYLTDLVCQKLIFGSKWKKDFHVTLSAFELMSGMAKINILDIGKDDCRCTIKWLCDYVDFQAKQPAPYHSRDLHSMMVAAFSCLLTWITSHPWLLDDQKSLQAILEVVELGISGSKSRATENQESSDPVKTQLKGDKVLKPASFRVREAAEGVLSCIMEHVGAFPSPCGPASCCSLLDEEILADYLAANKQAQTKRFQYFVIDETIIVGILQESVQDHDDLIPTATVLLRGPTGRTAWTVELRQIAECKKELLALSQSEAPSRPAPNEDITLSLPVVHQHFPPDVEYVPLAKANASIPPMHDIPCEKLAQDKDEVQDLIQRQKEEESQSQEVIKRENDNLDFPCSLTEMTPPRPVTRFSACRMILARLGLLRPEEYEKVQPMGPYDRAVTSLSPLNPSAEGFHDSLKELDHLPTRCYDSVYVLYVKRGQHEARKILTNKIKDCEHKKMFYEFLQSLGWPVDVKNHAGWTGNPATSWKLSHLKNKFSVPKITIGCPSHDTKGNEEEGGNPRITLSALTEESGSSASEESVVELDNMATEDEDVNTPGENQRIMYYGDISCEIAFIVPSLFPRMEVQGRKKSSGRQSLKTKDHHQMKRPVSVSNIPSTSSTSSLLDALPETRGLSLSRNTADTTIDLRHLTKLNTHSPSSETNILVVWLENFVDHEAFPENELLAELAISKDPITIASPSGRPQERETDVIFISPLHNGLFRIHTKSTTKSPLAGPLVDGMVVSRRSLGSMVRHTAINIGRRRRHHIDNYSPPQVCRKLKIQDVVRKFRQKRSFPEFYSSLFEEQI